MTNEKRLIDANQFEVVTLNGKSDEFAEGARFVLEMIDRAPIIDAVPVVRCKDCRWAKPYERIDGKTGYYCHFCGHSFKYGANWERLYTPIKEANDFCSYGERRNDDA